MTCSTCNGWGIILTLNQAAPENASERLRQRRIMLHTGRSSLLGAHVRETVCLQCGGYGTRPAVR